MVCQKWGRLLGSVTEVRHSNDTQRAQEMKTVGTGQCPVPTTTSIWLVGVLFLRTDSIFSKSRGVCGTNLSLSYITPNY